ncbi:MAG: hypothetical protein E7617_02350 [Ruminococcaceae bacterium]|nr:hypothetical protein [Oscillospiraceae bacterium]
MKKIISIMLTLALVLSLAFTITSCDFTGGGSSDGGQTGGNNNEVKLGVLTVDGKTYFKTNDGAVVIEDGAATAATAPEGAYESKGFDAPATTDVEFTYTESAGKITITGLKADTDLVIIPETIGGKQVAVIESLKGAKTVILAKTDSAITVNNGAFEGVSAVYLATTPDLLLVGSALLDNNSTVKLYATADQYANFKNHYNWGTFADKISKL